MQSVQEHYKIDTTLHDELQESHFLRKLAISPVEKSKTVLDLFN